MISSERLKPTKFVCDVMLGRLAKWLRMLGYDTLYDNNFEDYELLKIALQTERILLTRDVELYEMAGDKRAYLLSSEILEKQLAEMIEIFDINTDPTLEFCPVCNGKIVEIVDKASIKGAVPEYTYKIHDRFFRCLNCGKIYWNGSHMKLAEDFLERIDDDE